MAGREFTGVFVSDGFKEECSWKVEDSSDF